MANVYVRSGAGGAGTGADWANAYTTLGAALTAKAAGDIFYVAADHAETAASAKTLTAPGTAASPNVILCVDHTGTVPPVSADIRTTATITTTGTNNLTIASGFAYLYGITFNCGTGAGASSLLVGNAPTWFSFDNCALKILSTGTSSATFGTQSTNTPIKIELNNTPLTFSSTSQLLSIAAGVFSWKNTASALNGTIPTTLFTVSSDRCIPDVLIEGVDLSALGSGSTIVGNTAATKRFVLKDCKLDSAVTVAAASTGQSRNEVFVVRSGSSGNYRNEKYSYAGNQTTELVLVRTGGASDGVTPISWKLANSANSKWIAPLEALPIVIKNTVTGSNVTVTMEGMMSAAALPNNDDFWFDVEYLGAAGSPLGSRKSGTKANYLAAGSALTASTQAWDSLASARLDLTAYALGDVIKASTNAGRVFFCTTAGTTAVSIVAGYASAVDGGSVTDGTAVFRAAMRFKLAVTMSSPQPAQPGYMYIYPKAAAASATYYICPKIALS